MSYFIDFIESLVEFSAFCLGFFFMGVTYYIGAIYQGLIVGFNKGRKVLQP